MSISDWTLFNMEKLNIKFLGWEERLSTKNLNKHWSSPPPLPWKQNSPSNSFEDTNMERKTQGASMFCCCL